jgi:hypothetical protein
MPLASRRKPIGVRDEMNLHLLDPVSLEVLQRFHAIEHFVDVVAVLLHDHERLALDREPAAARTALVHIENGAVFLYPAAIGRPGVHDHGDDLGGERLTRRRSWHPRR